MGAVSLLLAAWVAHLWVAQSSIDPQLPQPALSQTLPVDPSSLRICAFFRRAGPGVTDAAHRGWLRIEIGEPSVRPYGMHSFTIALSRLGRPTISSHSHSAGSEVPNAAVPKDSAAMGSRLFCASWSFLGSQSCSEPLEQILLTLLQQEAMLATLVRPPLAQASYESIFGRNQPAVTSEALLPTHVAIESLSSRALHLPTMRWLATDLWARFETSVPWDGTILDIDAIQVKLHWAVISIFGNITVDERALELEVSNHPGKSIQSWCTAEYPSDPLCASKIWSLLKGNLQPRAATKFTDLKTTLASYMGDFLRRSLVEINMVETSGYRYTWHTDRLFSHIPDLHFERTWGATLVEQVRKVWPPGNYTLTIRALLFEILEDRAHYLRLVYKTMAAGHDAVRGEFSQTGFSKKEFRPPRLLVPEWTQRVVVEPSGLAELRPCQWASADPKPKPLGLEVEYAHLQECTSCKQTHVSAISPGFSALQSKGANTSGTVTVTESAYESIGSGGVQLLVDDFALDLALSRNIIRHMSVAKVQESPVMRAEVGKEKSRFALGELERRNLQVDSVEFPGSVLEQNGTLHAWYLAMSTGICYATSSDYGQSWIKPSIHADGSNYIFVHNRTETRLLSNEVSVTFDSAKRTYLMTYCQSAEQTVQLLHSNDGMHWCEAHASYTALCRSLGLSAVTAGGARTRGSWWAEAATVRSPWCRWAKADICW